MSRKFVHVSELFLLDKRTSGVYYHATMPAKGSKYATVDIDLQQWLKDEMDRTGKKQAAIARELGVERARVHELFYGKANTMNNLEIIVEKAMKGDYEGMAKYAQTGTGLKMLKRLNFEKKLTPYQRDVYDRFNEVIQKKILEDPDKALEVLKKLES